MAIEQSSKIDLISRALILCGEKPLNSLSDDRYGATVGGSLFEMLYENQIQSNPWRFSMAKKALSQLVSTPLNTWRYAYQLPTDMLLPRGIVPVDPNYEIYADHLYTNYSSVDLEYQFKPAVTACPAYFTTLVVYELTKNMIGPITESEASVKRAEGWYATQRSVALYADAQGRPAKPVAHSPFIAVRGGGR